MTSEPPTGRLAPGGFDLARDVAGGLPLTLVERWLATGRGAADARRLLSGHTVRGYGVVSDTSGLTKVSGRLGLLEVLALIDRPKRVLHRHGAAAGGRAVGVWAADNAQMFHPASTDPRVLLSALLRARDEIERHCRVRVGVGVHLGDFYDLAGGLYGPDADLIEDLAENHVEGGEIAVTQAVVDRLPDGHGFVLRRGREADGLGAVHLLLDGPRPPAERPPEAGTYPIPYSSAFYADLLRLDGRPDDAGLAARLAARHLRRRTVVLVERDAVPAATPELALLNGLALSSVMSRTGLRLIPRPGAMEVKVSGPLAIYLFDDPAPAVRFAERMRAGLADHGISCRIGVDTGPVLAGETPSGGWDVAGAPVNVASKMAQDLGTPGRIYLSEAMGEHVPSGKAYTPVRHTVSGVSMTCYEG
ncbi:adenylate/guanylate cyclase domain-containing protein [Sphaerisporangium sp. NPDC005289]|uniref:adenylate/guanylate cyclase domain-containing protein n=1 Tax=Sphaerisporangium sp. NPDC005289 TaxID=3155247 RepID=UPI0033AE10E6